VAWHQDVTIPGGTPVGGHADLSISSNGLYYYSGLLRDSGWPSYAVQMVWALRGPDATVYTFTARGRANGTDSFGDGSRDFRWGVWGHSNELACAWNALSRGQEAHVVTAHADWNPWDIAGWVGQVFGLALRVVSLMSYSQ
jgi:hypothetical protein